MAGVVLNDEFFAKAAGWEVMKQARSSLASGKVLSSNWTEPVLRGVVQEGASSYRAGLVIKSNVDIENLCTCRTSREWGTICAHSVAIGLHYLRRANPDSIKDAASLEKKLPLPGLASSKATAPKRAFKRLRRVSEGEEGEPLEISVIFPPNLSAALPRGKVMLFFEGKWAKGRSPLNSLPDSVPFELEPEDQLLLDVAEEIAGDTPGMMQVGHPELARVLEQLKGHPRVFIGKAQELTVSDQPLALKLRAALQSSGDIVLTPETKVSAETLVHGKNTWAVSPSVIRPILLPATAREVLAGPVTIGRAQVPVFLNQDWPELEKSGNVTANFKLDDFRVTSPSPEIRLELTGGLANLQGKLHFVYGSKVITAGTGSQHESFWIPDPADARHYITRNFEAEQNAQGRLARAGFTGPHTDGLFQLAGQNSVLSFFARDYQRMEREWKVTLEERLERSTKQNLERVEPKFEVTPSGEQWFDLGVAYQSSGGERFSQTDIQRLILSGQSHTKLRNGKFALIDTGAVEELQEVLLDCSPKQNDRGYRIQNNQAGFLSSALQENPTWKVNAPPQWTTKAVQQSGSTPMAAPPLGSLENILRPYQKHGVAWLEFLRQNNFGGILADEMGLGKTLQTLAFLRGVRERTPQAERSPCLIVCPTSLVFNWLAEAEKFTPELKVVALQGPRRHDLFDRLAEFDLVVTSYALVRRDLENYRGLEFDTVVLDEAQHIKNRQTQNAQAVKAVRSRHRVVLTGTPLENSVLDLWSIYDFLMPGYLGSANDFKERYEAPITREKNTAAQARLARRIRPFLLRRLKREVARDLPEKIEQVSFCELTSEQNQVYQQLLQASRQEILAAVGEQGLQRSRMVILTALLRLRQVCCDLRLLKLEKASEHNSGKLDLFNELLQEVIDGGHRVLVFSQFVEMLHLLKDSLDAQSIKYSYLDGSTSDRGKVVQEFQGSSNIPVFLISLKAGGVGLNLSAADTVIHFDPWWNPAVEAQATDRAHRIGQTRVVTSYKMITRGTVEEKILNLQNRKRELIAATLSGEDELTANLSLEELEELLQ